MTKKRAGRLRGLATRFVIAALPVAIVSVYASGIFTSPPRTAAFDVTPVAEIVDSPSTVGLATSPLYGQTLEQINQQLDEMQAIGVQNIRVFVPWGLVEQQDDTYMWNHIDDIMAAAAARNMGVLAEVNATPLWAGPNPNAPGFPVGADTPNVEKFTDFMRDFVGRYGETVSAYEIWNEPNYVQFSNPINPEAYAALLAAVYPVIKELDGTATVVAGAVGATQNSPFTMSPVDFVQRMLAAGAGSFFDALSVHPYGEEMPYSGSCPSCPPSMLTPREQVEAIMGMLEGKKVWITEYGLPTAPGGPWTEADQAAFIKDLLDHWQTYGEDLVGPIFLYTGRDTPNPADPTNVHDYYGLWTQDGVLKPAGQMLRDWLEAHQPGGPGEPGEPGQPQNPIAFLAAVVQAITQAIAQAIANFFGQFAPPAPTPALVAQAQQAPELVGRMAAVESPEDAAPVSQVSMESGEGVVAEPAGAEVAEPVAVEPEVAEPQVFEPEVTEPVAVEPEVSEPVGVEPDVVEPDIAEPEVTEPESGVGTMPPSETATEPAPSVDAEPSTATPDASPNHTSDGMNAQDPSDEPAKPAKPAKADKPEKPAKADKPSAEKAEPNTPHESPTGSKARNVTAGSSVASESESHTGADE